MKKIFLFLYILLPFLLNAQVLHFENINQVSLRNAAAIRHGVETKGFFFFYKADKINKKTDEYKLQIVDNNLNKIKEVTLQAAGEISLIQASSNGDELIFVFLNFEKKLFEYRIYGNNGEEKLTYERIVTKKELDYLSGAFFQMQDESQTFDGLFSVDGQGFLSEMSVPDKMTNTYRVDYFSSKVKKTWTYFPAYEGKYCSGEYLGEANGVLFFSEFRNEKPMAKNPSYVIVGLDIETGKVLFEKPTASSKYTSIPKSMFANDKGQAVIYGKLLAPNTSIIKAEVIGASFWTFDAKGNLVEERYWDREAESKKYFEKKNADRTEKMPIGEFLRLQDGSSFIVGDRFKQVGEKGQSAEITIIRLDKDFAIADFKVFPFDKDKAPVSQFFSSHAMIPVVRKYSILPYTYTQASPESNSFTIYYSDVEKEKRYNEGDLRAITYADGKFSEDRVRFQSKSKESFLLPGRQGQMLILDYYQKEKRLEMRIEKMN